MASFTSFDGTRINYEVQGEGYPLILVNGLVCDASYWKYLIAHLSPWLKIVTWDLRGHGQSAAPAFDAHVRIEDHARDLGALIDHLGLERPIVGGFSLGVQIMFEAYRQLGTRLGALIGVTGPYRNPLSTFYGLPISDGVIDALFKVAYKVEKPVQWLWPRIFSSPAIYPLSRLTRATRASRKDMQGFYDHAREVDVHLFFRFAQAAAHHSAEDVLPLIQIPTLIIGAKRDTFTPGSLSDHMAKTIPDADYLYMDKGTHTAIIEEPEKINSHIEMFLRERLPQAFERVPG